MKFASTVTVVVFTDAGLVLTAGRAAAAVFAGVAALAVEVAEAAGAGVPSRVGVALTVRSLPCVSMIAVGNCANFSSSAAGRRALASAKSASTAGERAVFRLQSYCVLCCQLTRYRCTCT